MPPRHVDLLAQAAALLERFLSLEEVAAPHAEWEEHDDDVEAFLARLARLQEED
jgi:hypothetical protein